MIDQALLQTLSPLAAAHFEDVMTRYAVTSYGANPWTQEALKNAIALSLYVERAVAQVNGRLSSMYRSVEVNSKVPGASPTSLHIQGRAADIMPGQPWMVESAFGHLRELAAGGIIGPVRMVIWEPTWVHVDWYLPGSAASSPRFRRKVAGHYAVA